MKTDFNGLRTNIARSFNKLHDSVEDISYMDAEEQAKLYQAMDELKNEIWNLMCVYIDEKDANFWETIKLKRYFEVEQDND